MQFNLTYITRSVLLGLASFFSVAAATACEQKPAKQPEPTTKQAPAESAKALKPPSAGNHAPEQADSADLTRSAASITAVGDGDLVGRVSREMIVAQREDWNKALDEASPDREAARALASVEPGAELTIYFGAWCEDCQREVPRFLKALDAAGDVPFTYEFVGVDKYFRADEVSQDPIDIPAIPLFAVERDGKVVGRIIEKPSDTIERDLLALLQGKKSGDISANEPTTGTSTDSKSAESEPDEAP